MPIVPQVKWAQRKDTAYLTVDLQDAKDVKVDLTEQELKFSARQEENEYAFSLEFHGPIVVDESKWGQARNVVISLKKKEAERWPRLTKEPTKASWLKTDWNKWVDTDDEESGAGANPYGDFDFSNMMGGMGGMGGAGMPGGFDMGDDEDMGDLSEEDDDDEEEAQAADKDKSDEAPKTDETAAPKPDDAA